MTNGRGVLALWILGGTAIAALAIACTFGGGRMARAESPPLALDAYTADTQGIGVTSTLIYGEHEAILVDTQFRIGDAEKLADRIAAKGRRLKAILVTHPHFDHFYGTSVLLERFPGTPVYASASDVEYIKGDLASTVAQIRARFGADTIPAEIQIPQRGRTPISRWTVSPSTSSPACRATWVRGRGTMSSGSLRWPPR